MNNELFSLNRIMSARDFAAWGQDDVAYIKAVRINDQIGWSIHSADGSNLGLADDRDSAFAAVLQNEMNPLSVH